MKHRLIAAIIKIIIIVVGDLYELDLNEEKGQQLRLA